MGGLPRKAWRVWDVAMLGRLPHQTWLGGPSAQDQAMVEAQHRAVRRGHHTVSKAIGADKALNLVRFQVGREAR